MPLPTRPVRGRRLAIAGAILVAVAGTLGAAEARSRAPVHGRLFAATLDGGVVPYPARKVWLVPDSPELRRALRRACGSWMAALATDARERQRLQRLRMATLDSALAPSNGAADADERRVELMRRSEAAGDSLVALGSRVRGAVRTHTPDAVAAAFARDRLRTDSSGAYEFEEVKRGAWFVVPESVDPVAAPARWYAVKVGSRAVTQDLGGASGLPWCDVGR